MKSMQKGFTLVEIAIVLVIIGLLLGGILKGQEMITQAKIKNVMADFSGISAAYHGYQDRYRRLPGDDSQAAARWTDLTAGAANDDGDGNGVVAGAYNGAGNIESRNFWLHLRKAGFVAGTGKDQPFNALTGMLGVQTGNGATPPVAALLDAGGPGFVGLIMCSANLPDKIAIAVDTQMDDGLAGKGTVRALAQAAPNPAIGAVDATPAYAETGSNVYTICRAL
jgi:prepilin-type N-terminal cleavage/methylation domain-containing protein